MLAAKSICKVFIDQNVSDLDLLQGYSSLRVQGQSFTRRHLECSSVKISCLRCEVAQSNIPADKDLLTS